jgi:toxin secretion/phage lysis holin
MQTATIKRNYYCDGMLNLNFIPYLFNPKLIGTLLFLDITGIMQFITKYVFADITYLKFLIIACIVDLITGVWKVIVAQGIKSVSSKGLRGTVTKVISYGSFLVLVHLITHFQINGQTNAGTAMEWINKAALEFLILIEFRSIYENIKIINPKLDFIDPVLQKLLDKFKTKKNDSK